MAYNSEYTRALTFENWCQLGHIGSGLAAKGLAPKDRAVIYAETSREWWLSANGIYSAGMAVVTVYATLGKEGLMHGLVQVYTQMYERVVPCICKCVCERVCTHTYFLHTCIQIWYTHTHTHTHTHTQTKAKVLFADAKLMPIIATLDKAALKNLKHVVYFADTPQKPDEKMAGKVAVAMETIKKAGVDVVTLGD